MAENETTQTNTKYSHSNKDIEQFIQSKKKENYSKNNRNEETLASKIFRELDIKTPNTPFYLNIKNIIDEHIEKLVAENNLLKNENLTLYRKLFEKKIPK